MCAYLQATRDWYDKIMEANCFSWISLLDFKQIKCFPISVGAWSPIGDVTTTMLWISHGTQGGKHFWVVAGETNDVNVRSILIKLPTDVFLGVGFKHFLFSPLLGEMIQIDTTR